MSTHETRNREVFVRKLMETAKNLRELLSRLPIDFDPNHLGRTNEMTIPDFEPGADEGEVVSLRIEIEDVGHDPVQKVCRLICRRHEDVLIIYSLVMREYGHMGARDGEFSDAFWASAKLNKDGNPTMVNGVILPFVTTEGFRLIPTDQQLDEDRRAARVGVGDLNKIGKIIELTRATLPLPAGDVGGVALRLVE